MKKYIVEPRNPDGSFNVKKLGDPPFNYPRYTPRGISEDRLFDIYFSCCPDKEKASWAEMRAYFKENGGYEIREKTW